MKVRTLVLCDDQWHPAATVRQGLKSLSAHGVEFEFHADGNRWSPALLKDFPSVIVVKANHIHANDQRPWLTEQTQESFREYAQRGGGLVLIHGGTCYKDLPLMREVTGGAFLRHPEQCPVTFRPVAGHPVAAGVKEFMEVEEPYFMALDATDADVFLYAHSEHGKQPAGWLRTVGAGRVGVLTPGHNVGTWLNPEFQKLLLKTLCWTGKIDLQFEEQS